MVINTGARCKKDNDPSRLCLTIQEVYQARKFLGLIFEKLVEVIKVLRYFRNVLNLVIHDSLVHFVELLNCDGFTLMCFAFACENALALRCANFNVEWITHSTLNQVFQLRRHCCREKAGPSLLWKLVQNVLHFDFIAAFS